MAESVLDGAGGEALGWLSYRFEIERWHGFGAHAGWWRLLLRYIQRAELAVGVDAFSRALRGAYGFVLIRDADLRGEVGHLLLHGDDQPFRAVAIAALKSADVEERLGAAMLLVSCDTDPPFEALVEVLHGFDALLGIHNPWEWEHFLAGRLFPKSVTDRLVAHTTTMQPRARAMALFLAKGRTGEAPDPEIDGQIVRHVLVGDLTMMDPTGTKTSLLSSESGRATLAEEIQAGGQRAATAAENLLRYHRSTLSLVEHARVAVVAARGGYWRVGRIRELLAGMRRDEEFRREVNSQVLDAGPSGTGDLLWLILSNAGSEAWEPALESLFPFGGHDQHSMEEPGLLLLRSELPDGTRRAIGVAAAAVLDRRNDESRTSADGGAWLALLADEHYVERHISLADYVQPLIGHYSNVLPALRARTAGEPSFGPWPGAAPLRPASAYDIPTGNSTILTANSMRSLSDLVSPDGPFENQCMQRLHAVIVADVDGVVTELTKAGAAEERWAAIQGVLEWIDGRAPSIEVLQAGSPALLNGGEGRNGESAANLAQWWWLAQRDALRLDYVLRDRFLEVMSDSVVRRTSDVAGGGALLLSQRGHLLAHEIESVVGAVLDPSNLHVSLVRELCKWVSRGIPGTQRTGAIAAFDAVIARLDASPGHDFVFARGVAPLAVPLLSWALGAEVSEAATRVFVRGVGGLRTSQGPHRETAVTVEVIAPVLPKVDVGIVSRALEFGIRNGALFDRINCFLFAAGLRARVPLN